jgi:hypothetical protein
VRLSLWTATTNGPIVHPLIIYVSGSQTVGPVPPAGLVSPLGGEFFVWGTYLFWKKYGNNITHIFFRHLALITYCAYHSAPVLAADYNQHILSPAKFRKVRYLLTDLCVERVYFNLFGWRGAWAIKVLEPLIYISMTSNGGMILTGENWKTRRKLSQVSLVYHKSHTDWPWREPRPPWWEAGD